MHYSTLISSSELMNGLDYEDLVIIDCRFSLADTNSGRGSYLVDHIPRAIYAHLDDDLSGEIRPGETGRHPLPSIEKLTKLFTEWGIDENVQVVVYDDKSGAIASRLWWMLRWLGHEKVAVLNGGWSYWFNKNMPVSGDVPTNKPRKFTPKVQENWVVDMPYVESIPEHAHLTLVDSRTNERYLGIKEPIDPIAGHIPGAINAPHPENVGSDGLLHSPDKLKDRFSTLLGEKSVEDTVFYCGSGVTACANLLAMEYAGMGSAKLYPGSWSEWITKHNGK